MSTRKIKDMHVYNSNSPNPDKTGLFATLYYIGYNQSSNYSIYKITSFDSGSDSEDPPDYGDYNENIGSFYFYRVFGTTITSTETIKEYYNITNLDWRQNNQDVYFYVYHNVYGKLTQLTCVMNFSTKIDDDKNPAYTLYRVDFGIDKEVPTIPKKIIVEVGEGGSKNGWTEYHDYGTTYTLTAPDPKEGYNFSNWQDGLTDKSRTETTGTAQQKTFRANYSERTWSIVTKMCSTYGNSFGKEGEYEGNKDPDGEIIGSVSDGGTYYYVSQHEQKAYAYDGENYHFVKWTWNDGKEDHESTDREITISPQNNVTTITCMAHFEPNKYTINTTYDEVHISSVTGGGTYKYKDNATLEAIPKSRCRFTKWTDDTIKNPRTVLVIKDGYYYTALGEPDYNGITITTLRSCRVNNYTDLVEENTSELVYIKIFINDDKNYRVQKVSCDGHDEEMEVTTTSEGVYCVIKTELNVHMPSYYYFTIYDAIETNKYTVYVRAGLVTLMEYQNKLNKEDVGVGLGVYPEANSFSISGDMHFDVSDYEGNKAIDRNVYDFLNKQLKIENISYDSGILKNAEVADTNKYKWVCNVYTIDGNKFLKCCACLKTTVTVYEEGDNITLLDLSKYGLSFSTRIPVNIVKEDDNTKQCAVALGNKIITKGKMDKGTILYVNIWLPLIENK